MQHSLLRGLGVAAATSVVVGSVIGTGIFLKTRVMMCNVDSPSAVMAAWVVAGLLTVAGAFAYAELATMMPRAGGEYVFIREGYGRQLAFLYGWTQFAVAYSGGQAAKGVAFAIFLNEIAGGALGRTFFAIDVLGHPVPFGPLQIVALGVIVVATLANLFAISVGGRIVVFLTSLKIAIVIAIGLGAFALARGSWDHFAMTSAGAACAGVAETARGGIAGFGAALVGALWAYDGWTNGSIVAGEVRDPRRVLPIALIGGTLIVGTLYLFANLSYFFVLSPVDLANVADTSSVGTEVVRQFVGPAAVALVAVAMMVSTLGTLHTGTMAGARVSYAMANDNLFFAPLARVSAGAHVPANALLLQCAWSCVLALSGSYDTLTDYVIFASWIFYGLNVGSVFILRRRMPGAERPYRTPGYPVVPLIFILAAAYITVNTLVATPRQAVAGLGIILLGVPVYAYWARKARRPERVRVV